MPKNLIVTVIAFSFVLNSCGGEHPILEKVSSFRTGQRPPVNQVFSYKTASPVWEPCPDDLTGMGGGECASYRVPLFWENPKGEQIDLFVRRYLADRQYRGQVWALDGGPGATGVNLANPALLQLFLKVGWDVYIPMHRGTGFSSPLTCSQVRELQNENGTIDETNFRRCSDELKNSWNGGLAAFSSYQAALDVGYLVNDNQEENRRVAIYGVSYGTYLAQRYLQYFPSQASVAVLDGVVGLRPPMDQFPKQINSAGLSLLKLCRNQQFCGSHFQKSPTESLKYLFSDAGWQNCAPRRDGLINRERFRKILYRMANDRIVRNLIPALIYRMERCNADDVNVLTFFALRVENWGKNASAYKPLMFNSLLNRNIVFNEWFGNQPDSVFVIPDSVNLYFSGVENDHLLSEKKYWPLWNSPNWTSSFVNSVVPVLALQGALDLKTPVSEVQRLASQFSDSLLKIVIFPNAGHGTPDYTRTRSGKNCSFQLIRDFIGDPEDTLDLRCLNEIPSLDFLVQTDQVKRAANILFGRTDVWGK